MGHRLANLLQGDPGVQQPLDDLEHQYVAERVEPLRSRTGRVADRGSDQSGTCPVVQLTVRDTRRSTRSRAPITEVLRHRRDDTVEQQTLPVCGVLTCGRLVSCALCSVSAHADPLLDV